MIISDLMVVLGLKSTAFTTGMAKAEGQLTKFAATAKSSGAAASGLGSAAGTMGTAVAGGAAIAGAAIAALGVGFAAAAVTIGKSSIQTASSLQEVQNVVDVTFGSSSESINRFAKSAISSFGISELAAKQYAGTMGAALKSSGLGSQATELSQTLTGLSADFASFYNATSDDAFQKIMAGVIGGEIEPLRRWGINMSVANVEAFNMAQGIRKSYSEMTQAEQVLSRYNYLLANSADAQGDFARTSDSWANQTRLLTMQWEQFKAALGSGLMDALLPALQHLNTFMAQLVTWGERLGNWLSGTFGSTKTTAQVDSTGYAIGNVAANASVAAGEIDGISKAIGGAAKAAKGALAPFDQLNILSIPQGGGGGGGGNGGNGGTYNPSPWEKEANRQTVDIGNKQRSPQAPGAGAGSPAWTAAGGGDLGTSGGGKGVVEKMNDELYGPWRKVNGVIEEFIDRGYQFMADPKVAKKGFLDLLDYLLDPMKQSGEKLGDYKKQTEEVIRAQQGTTLSLDYLKNNTMSAAEKAQYMGSAAQTASKNTNMLGYSATAAADSAQRMGGAADIASNALNGLAPLEKVTNDMNTAFSKGAIESAAYAQAMGGAASSAAGFTTTFGANLTTTGTKLNNMGNDAAAAAAKAQAMGGAADQASGYLRGLSKTIFDASKTVSGVYGVGQGGPKGPPTYNGYASGGVFTAPSTVRLAEDGRKEAVIPLERSNPFADRLARQINGNGNNGPQVLYLMMGDDLIGTATARAGDRRSMITNGR